MSLEHNSPEAKGFFEKGYNRAKERFQDADFDGAVEQCWGLIDTLYHDAGTDMSFEKYSAHELTIMAGKLAILKAYIGRHAADAVLHTNNAYIYKSFQKAGKRKMAGDRLKEIGGKITVADIDAEVVKMSIREEQDWVFNQGYADTVVNLFKSIEWILTSIGWRIKELNSERMDTKHYDNTL